MIFMITYSNNIGVILHILKKINILFLNMVETCFDGESGGAGNKCCKIGRKQAAGEHEKIAGFFFFLLTEQYKVFC